MDDNAAIARVFVNPKIVLHGIYRVAVILVRFRPSGMVNSQKSGGSPLPLAPQGYEGALLEIELDDDNYVDHLKIVITSLYLRSINLRPTRSGN